MGNHWLFLFRIFRTFFKQDIRLTQQIEGIGHKKVGILDKWRASWDKHHYFSSKLYIFGITEFVYVPLYKNRVFVHQKYVVEGLSTAQIAAEIFSSKEAIRAALIRFEIPIREAHKPHGKPAQLRYGQKMRSGRAAPHLAEQQMIATIRELRSQGLTLRKIAQILTAMSVPTKKRGKSWHPEMVNRILANW